MGVLTALPKKLWPVALAPGLLSCNHHKAPAEPTPIVVEAPDQNRELAKARPELNAAAGDDLKQKLAEMKIYADDAKWLEALHEELNAKEEPYLDFHLDVPVTEANKEEAFGKAYITVSLRDFLEEIKLDIDYLVDEGALAKEDLAKFRKALDYRSYFIGDSTGPDSVNDIHYDVLPGAESQKAQARLESITELVENGKLAEAQTAIAEIIDDSSNQN